MLAAMPAVAGDSALDWLQRMNEAGGRLSYSGTFVYLHEDQIEAMRVVHLVDGATTRERLYSLNGEAREVVRDDQQIWCYLPNRKIGVQEFRKAANSGFPNVLPAGTAGLKDNYELHLGGEARVADRAARTVTVMAGDGFRYSHRFWIDSDTGLLLKADLVDAQGRAVEQYMFTTIRIGDEVSAKDAEPRTPRNELVWHGERVDYTPFKGARDNWTLSGLPPGYVLTSDIVRYLPMQKTPVRHLVYSDGLASFSVFIEKMPPKGREPMRGLTRMGAVHAFGKMLHGHQITVVGEVPEQTVVAAAGAVQAGH
jgi:sigma-E factor negative regulatory protein RseB